MKKQYVFAMTETEQREWVAMLGPDRESQIKVLRDLLVHACEDEMIQADRSICQRQLKRLAEELV